MLHRAPLLKGYALLLVSAERRCLAHNCCAAAAHLPQVVAVMLLLLARGVRVGCGCVAPICYCCCWRTLHRTFSASDAEAEARAAFNSPPHTVASQQQLPPPNCLHLTAST